MPDTMTEPRRDLLGRHAGGENLSAADQAGLTFCHTYESRRPGMKSHVTIVGTLAAR